jgi:hypothetical protein
LSTKTDLVDKNGVGPETSNGTTVNNSTKSVPSNSDSNSTGISNVGSELALGSGADYYSASITLPLFASNFNVSLGLTIDRFGQGYFSLSPGVGTKGFGASLTSNYLVNQPNGTEQDMRNFLTGYGTTVSGGYGVGIQATASGTNPNSGKNSFGIGVSTPGAGVSYGFTWEIFNID